MSNNIKGITVEIGGDTGPLTSALKGVNKTAGDLQSELREVNRQLKFDPKNTTLLTQKIDLLKQNTQTLGEKQKTLKTAVEQAHAAFEKGELGADKVRAVEREYEKVNSQLKNSKQELNEVERTSGTFGERVKATFSSIGQSFRSAFNWNNVKAGIGAAGIAITAFLKGSVEEASEAQKSEANLEQSLKSTKGAAGMTMQSLNELTEAMMANTTFSKDEIESGEGMLLTFTKIGKDVFPQATAAVLDFAQKMGTDPKTAALQLGKALNDPATGLSKLTKSGVTFTDQQKKQITAMEKAGNVAGAQKLMIAELNKEFGGQAAAAADTYAGKQKQLANMMKELKEVIGSAVIPVLNAMLKPITPILQAIAKFVSENPKLMVGILALVGVIGTLIGGLSLANTVAGLFGHTMRLNEVLMTGGVMLGIMALIAAVALIITHWKQVSAFFVNLWNTIKGLFSGIGAWFTSVFGQAASGVQSAWSGVTGFFSGIWNGIKNIFSAVGNWFSGIFGSAWNGIKSIWSGVTGFFSGIWHGITGIFGSAGNWFGNVFNGAKKAIYDHFSPSALSDHFNNVWKAVQNTFSKLNPMQWGKDLIDGIANGIRSAADHVKQAVGNVATTIRSFLHFSRPDTGDLRDYESWMPDFMKGLANGIRNSTAPVINAAKGVASGIAANIRIPQTVTSGLQLRTALAAAGGYSSGSGGSTSDSISRSPIPGLTVIFKGNSFGNKEVAKTDVDKISNAIALKVQAKK